MRLALGHQRKLEDFAHFAGLFLCIRGRHVPEVVAGIQSGKIHTRSGNFLIQDSFREHRCGADPQCVGYRVWHGLPLEVHRCVLWIFCDDGRKVQRFRKIRGRQHIRFLNRAAARDCQFLMWREVDLLLAALHLRAAAGNHDLAFLFLRIKLHRRAAVGMQLSRCVLRTHRGFGIRRAQGRRRQIHCTCIDAHGDAGRPVVFGVVLFHGNECVGLDQVDRTIRESDARIAV